jgi:hypothetical protein
MRRQAYRAAPWVLLAFGLALSGCAPYTAVAGKQVLTECDVEVTAPADWYRANRAGNVYLITRDGLALQSVLVQRVPVDEALRFTKRKFDDKLPPAEVAEVELDDVRSNPDVLNLAVEENAPATLDGRSGFRLVYTWNTKDGLRLKRVHYGFRDGKYVYRLVYQAAARYYFERDLATFETVRQSFRVLSKPA